MEQGLIELKDENFSEKTKKGEWIVDFWAAWCGPCRMMAPEFAVAARESKKINFGKLDVDSNQETAGKFEVMSIPTLIFIKNGKEVGRNVGLVGKDVINAKAKEFF
jgi:thioredoxin